LTGQQTNLTFIFIVTDMLPQQYYNEKVHIFNTWF